MAVVAGQFLSGSLSAVEAGEKRDVALMVLDAVMLLLAGEAEHFHGDKLMAMAD